MGGGGGDKCSHDQRFSQSGIWSFIFSDIKALCCRQAVKAKVHNKNGVLNGYSRNGCLYKTCAED